MKEIVMVNKAKNEMRRLTVADNNFVLVEGKRIGEWDVYFAMKTEGTLHTVENYYKNNFGYVRAFAQ